MRLFITLVVTAVLYGNVHAAGALDLMPVPAALEQREGQLRIAKDFTIGFAGPVDPRLHAYATRVLRRLDGRTGLFLTQRTLGANDTQPQATLLIEARGKARLAVGDDESYSLVVGPHQVKLSAATDTGAMRGLETVLQLVAADANGYYLPQLKIDDTPRFPWRGLMIDTARHFMPLEVIKRNIDGMAAVKLNVLHLHLTDNQGFRIESKRFPRLHQMPRGEYYTQDEIRQIVAYAGARGIRVVPEFDLPAHATSWLAAYPELGSRKMAYQLEPMFGIFAPVLDPTREENYRFLDKLFSELLPLFPDQYVHIGGDENMEGKHWKENPAIQAFMKKRGMADNSALQAYFNQRMLKIFTRLNRKMIGWEEILHPDLPKTAVVQSWLGKESLFRAARQGYDTLLSQGFYIDLMQPASEHYLNDPILPEGATLSDAERARILGGEATMWSELVTAQTVDSRIWPRMAAIAERFWSPASVRDVDDMYRRMDIVSVRLEELGLTHMASRAAILRNLAGGSHDTQALDVLLNVVEPMKIYTRNERGTRYSVTAPFTLFADAANTDAPDARRFAATMRRYLAGPNAPDREQLRATMLKWHDNHAGINALIARSPMLKDVEALSAKLKAAAETGMSLLDSTGITPERYREVQTVLLAAREQGGRTELQVVAPIEALLARRFEETSFVAMPLTAPHSFTPGVEGPAVDAKGNVYAVNFERPQTIGMVTPYGKGKVFATLPGTSVGNGIRFDRAGAMFVADFKEHTVYRFEPGKRAPTVFAREAAMTQPNDLAITRDGVLYASDPDWKTNTGRVWRIDAAGRVTMAADAMGTANGIEVSPDGRTLYVNESVQRTIWAFTIAENGALTDKRRVASFDDFGLDGMRADIDGNLYVTRYGKGSVVKLAPDGRVLREISLPGKKPSNISFGGPDGRTAYVTEVENGQLLQFRVDRPGLEWQERL